MPPRQDNPLDRLAERRVLRFWTRIADSAQATDLGDLKRLRSRAKRLSQQLDRITRAAESRLALPVDGSNAMNRVPGTDWQWRPDLWRRPTVPRGHIGAENQTRLADHVTAFHDCPLNEVSLRQERNRGATDLAPYGLAIDVFGFEGTFLSIVIDFPREGTEGLKRRHVVRTDLSLVAERQNAIYARLNVKHGPNTAQRISQVQHDKAQTFVEFDLSPTDVNEKRVESAWMDLIFEKPFMNAFEVRDLVISRRPRAEL